MKKFVRSSLLLAALLVLSACGGKPEGDNNASNQQGNTSQQGGGGQSGSDAGSDTVAPVIMGTKVSLTCEAGKEFNLLDGVTAVDDVDGDITSRIVVETMPELPIANGVVSPTKDDTGFFDVSYTVKDAAGNEAQEFTELEVTEALAPKTLYKEYNFGADLQGWEPYINEGVTGTSGVSGGKYVFDITQSTGTDWHIKYAYYNYPVSAGHSYKVTARLTSDKAGKVMFNGAEKTIAARSNTITATFDAVMDGGKNIELQFGKLEGPFKVGIESIEIEDSAPIIEEEKTTPVEIQTSGLLTEGWAFNKDDWHCEFSKGGRVQGTITKEADSASVTVTRSGNSYDGKFIIQTKNNLTANVAYHVSVTFKSTQDASGLEYGYGAWGDDFKKFKEAYNYSLAANVEQVIEFDVTPTENFENPMFCLKMGNVPANTTVTATNFSVTYNTGAGEIDFTDEAFAAVWSETADRVSVKTRTKDSITALLSGNAEDPYKVSTNLDVKGVGLAAGKVYRVKLTLTSSVDLDKVNYMMGKPAWDPDSLFASGESIALTANEAKTISSVFMAPENISNAQIRVKYGNAPAGAEVTVSNLVLEQISYKESEPRSILDPTWAVNGTRNVVTEGDNRPTANATATDVTFTATGTGECWKAKASIYTRTTLNPGTRYHIAFKVLASESANGYEFGLGYSAGDFKEIDHKYEVKMTGGSAMNVEFFVEVDQKYDGDWGIGIFMGTAPTGSTVKVSDIVVEDSPAASTSESESFVFTPEGIGHYANGDVGAASDLYVENGVLVYDITALYHDSDWANKFFLSDIILDGGAKYIFELVVKADTNLSASLILNKSGAWDPRATQAVEITTEYTTITLETPIMTAPLSFELLLQDFHQNTEVEHAKISFQSIKIFSQAQAE